LVAGQAAEGRAAIFVRCLSYRAQTDMGAGALIRPPAQDLYA
jgi:hypothetical protein